MSSYLHFEEKVSQAIKDTLSMGHRCAVSDSDHPTSCRYLHPNGKDKCLVGRLIGEELYHPRVEGQSVYDVDLCRILEASLGMELGEYEVRILGTLQNIHDHSDSDDFVGEFSAGVENGVKGVNERGDVVVSPQLRLPYWCIKAVKEWETENDRS